MDNVINNQNFTKVNNTDTCCPEKKDFLISSVNFWLTEQCLFRCRYCYEGNIRNFSEKPNATEEIVYQVFEWLCQKEISGDNNNLSINFFGGEPLLMKNLIEKSILFKEQMKAKYNKNIKLSMTTNAYLLDETTIRLFKNNDIGLLISCDGDIETMVRWRGKPDNEKNLDIVKKVIENLIITLKYYGKITIRVTIPDEEVKNLYNNILFLTGLGAYTSAHFVSDGPGEITENGVLEYKRQLDKLYLWFKSHLMRGYVIPYNTVQRKIQRLLNLPIIGNDYKTVIMENKIENITPCGAGRGFIGISPDGKIYPCHRFCMWKEFCMGDIYSKEFNQDVRKIFLNNTRGSREECKKCDLLTCLSQCPASSYAKFNDLMKINKYQCEIERLEEDIAKRLIKECNIKVQPRRIINVNPKQPYKVYPTIHSR